MASQTPDFQWSRFYYPQILAGLVLLKRTSFPEHTEENDHDPVIQFYRAAALVGHQAAVRTDHVARERFWATLRLRSSAIAKARLVDYELAPAAPAEADLVLDLTTGLVATTAVVDGHALFQTTGDDPIVFEYDEDDDYEVDATGAYLVVEDDGGTLSVPSLPAALWGGTPVAGDALYFGHATAMFSKVGLHVDTAATGISVLRWEYHDGDPKTGAPDSVTDSSGQVRAVITTVFGATRGEDGGAGSRAQVVLRCLLTGQEETIAVTWDGAVNVALATGSLGQSSISTNADDYEVEVEWPELTDVVDGASASTGLDTTGEELEVSWTLPQTTSEDWTTTALDDTSAVSAIATPAYWIRARVVTVSAPSSPTVDTPVEPSKTTWSVKVEVRQGRRISERLGTTDGSASQEFTLAREDLMEVVELTVAGTAWTRVTDFLSSASRDKVYRLREEPDGSWVVRFGNGTNGKIPATSSEVVLVYRVGGDSSGNVGAATITKNRSGLTRVKNLRNPRAATGWEVKEGTTAESLDELRDQVPASLRTRGRAVTPEDHEDLAVAYRTTADGRQIVGRALAIEEGLGLKTIQLRTVGPDGAAPATADLTELGTYFNGTTNGVQRVGGVSLANHEVTPQAFNANTVDVTASVDVLADYVDGAKAAIEASLESILTPLATRDDLFGDGSTAWLWEWGDNGGKVSIAALQAAITLAVTGVVTVSISTPAADVTLAAGELPTKGTLAITVNSV